MKTVVITGCNRGLGLELLRKYASNGYNVIACTRAESPDFLTVCKQVEKEYGISISNLYFELSSKLQIEEAMQKLEEMEVSIDVLVNNAGINVMKPILYTEYEDLEQSFKVNYFAPVMIVKTIIGIMMRQGYGAIVNVTSIGSVGHQPGGCIYDASKAALNQLTITAAQEVAPLGIRVNAVACGPVNTSMLSSMPETVRKKLQKSTAMGRIAEPGEIADVIFSLSNDQTSYITGQIIRVDGGAII